MADEPMDYWPKPYERTGDTRAAMNEYLSWEVDQPAPSSNPWPKDAADLRSTDASIGTHLFFTNQWEGPKDL